MKCIVPGPNVKVLGRAIHSLAKLGDDLYIEFTTTELSFRTASASKTSYATFRFCANFFSFFSPDADSSSTNSVKCQISMKSSLSVFRSPVTLDRIVESLHIQLCADSDKLVFLLKYKKGYFKTYYIPVIECETLQVYYPKENLLNKLVVQPKIICELLSNFQSSDQEVTLKVTKHKLIIRNYSENETSHNGVRAEIKVEKGEFNEFNIDNETEITFCLKELKAVLYFTDNVSLPLTICFACSSKPILFLVRSEVFEADVVVSTFTGPDYVNSQTENSQIAADVPHENSDHLEFDNNKNDEFLYNMELGDDIGVTSMKSGLQNSENDTRGNNEKLKFLFQRCFDKEEFDLQRLPGYNVVLASDSDQDSD